MDDKKLQMTEQILEKEDVVFDSPYLRRLRKQAEEEAQATVQATVQKELKEWYAKGREEGRERKDTFLRYARTTLDALVERFEPPVRHYLTIQQHLTTITDVQTLRSLFKLVLRATTLEAFAQGFEQATGMQTKEQ